MDSMENEEEEIDRLARDLAQSVMNTASKPRVKAPKAQDSPSSDASPEGGE